MRYLNINQIKEGMQLAKPLYDKNGTLLLKSNSTLTKATIEIVKKHDYTGLYVFDSISSSIRPKDLISFDLVQKTLQALGDGKLDFCLLCANQIADELIQNPNISVDTVSIKMYDNYTYTHSLNVAVLSAVVAIGVGMSTAEVQEITLAGILHDLGKTCIPIEVLNKKERLTDEEYSLIQEHPRFGYEMLQHSYFISAMVKNAVLTHHENENGSGYPLGLRGNQIRPYAKILHICDVYDALVSKRAYKEAMNPAAALEYLFSQSGEMFDIEYVNVLRNYITLYPTGTTVELSSGEKAIVARNYAAFPTRPDLILEDGSSLSLLGNKNITITNLLV